MSRIGRQTGETGGVKEMVEKGVFLRSQVENPDELFERVIPGCLSICRVSEGVSTTTVLTSAKAQSSHPAPTAFKAPLELKPSRA